MTSGGLDSLMVSRVRSGRRGAAHEERTLALVAASYSRDFEADEVMQRQGVREQPAADYVGYKPARSDCIAEIIEITVENNPF